MRRLLVAMLSVMLVAGSSLVAAPPVKAATSAPGAPTRVTATSGTLSATVSWTPADSRATSFTVVSNPGGISATVVGTASSATVTGLGFGLAYNFSVAGTNSAGAGPSSAASNFVTPLPPGGPYHPAPNVVLLNNDITGGQPVASNLGDDPVHLRGLSAVVLNVTASQATVASTVQLVLNQQIVQTIPVAPGQQESSLAVVGVPATLTQGAVQVTSGRVHVEVDFVGFFTAPTTLRDHSGLLQTIPTATLLNAPIPAGGSTNITVLGQGGVPSAHVAAVLLNVTASGATGAGALSLRPAGTTATGATTVGFGSGQTTANRAVVPVPVSGAITVADRGAAANATIEVMGWFTDGTDATAIGSLYTPLTPARLVDTSAGGGPLLASESLTFAVWGKGGAPAETATAPPTSVVLQVTALAPAGPGSLAISGASVVDFAAGVNVSNVDVVHLAADGSASIAALGANTNVTIDLVGYLSGDMIVPGTTKKLTPSLLAGITSLTDTSITFAAGVQASPPIVLNDVINAGISPTTPAGFLRRVLAISTSAAGETVVNTRNASLPEALTAYSVNWTEPPRSGAFGMHQGVGRAASVALPPFQPPPGTSIDPNWPVLTLAGNGKQLVFPISASFSKLSGELDISDLELQLVPQLEFGNNFFSNPQFAVGLGVGLRFQANASILGTIAGQTWTPYDQEFRSAPTDVQVGPLSVIVQGLVEGKVTVDLTLQAGISATISADKYGLITAGYDNGFFSNAKAFDYIPPSKTVIPAPSLQAEFRPGLHFIGGVVLYGFAVAAADENPYYRITVDPFANPWWDVALGVCKHIVIGIDINFYLLNFKKEATIDLPCDEIVVLTAPGNHINITIAPSPATVPRSGTQHFTAATDNNTAHGVTWSVVEANGGTLSNATITAVDYTAPSRAGTYHLRATAVDDLTSTQDVQITVTATPPSAPTSVAAALAGSAAATVTWAAPTDDGGAPIADYKVVSSDGTVIDAGTSMFATFGSLTAGTTYTFSVYATNSANLSSAAAVSPPVTVPSSQAVVTITPTSINFGANAIGNLSQPQTVTVSVTGGALAITSVALSGARPQDYAIQNDQCSTTTVSAPGSCSFQVVFTAAIQGTSTATVLVTDNAADSPQSIALQGSGPVISHFAAVQNSQFVDAQHGWVNAIGMWATADGGKSWTPETVPAVNTAGGHFRFVDANHGFLVGRVAATTPGCFNSSNCNAVMGTTDGGVTWARLSLLPLTQPTGLWFSDANHGWVSSITFVADPSGVGNGRTQVYATSDGGHTWSLQSLPDPQFNTCTLAVDDRVLQVSFLDASNGWALGMSACIDHSTRTISNPLTLAWSTTDGGAHWTVHDTGLNTYNFVPYSRLHVVSANQVSFATQDFNGNGGPIFVTTADGGTLWTRSVIPDLFAGDFQYIDANDVVLIGGANGAQSVYKSSDGGQTWTKVAPLPTQLNVTTSNFTEIRFIETIDATHWWVSGAVDYPTAQGGTIYLSSDGGVTWTLQLAGDGT